MAGHIYAIVNELSFERQFCQDTFADGLLEFLRSCNRIKEIGKEHYTIMYLATIYVSEIAHGLTYASALKIVKGKQKDEILMLKMNMDKACWKKLDDIGYFMDANERYHSGARDVSNSGLAEAYEYEGLVAGDDSVVVINIPKSSFGTGIDVKKDSDNETRNIKALNSEKEAIAYLLGMGFSMPYDRKSTMHPLPEQTILADKTLFKKTNRKNVSEYLYERIGHRELWCLDDTHVDGSAHFEIFSMADDTWKGENRDLQNINPDYRSKKHKGSKIRG